MIGRISRAVMIYIYKLLFEPKCYVIVNDFGIVVISILSNFYMSIFGYVQSIKIKTYLLKIFSNVEFFTKYDNISIYNLMFRHFVIWSLCPINGHSRIVMSRITWMILTVYWACCCCPCSCGNRIKYHATNSINASLGRARLGSWAKRIGSTRDAYPV